MNNKSASWSIVLTTALVSVAIGVLPGIALAKKGGNGPGGGGGQTSFKVCVTFDNLSTDGVLSDDVPALPSNSTPYCNKVDRVVAITGDGFRLDTTRGARSLLLDFGSNGPGLFVMPFGITIDALD